MVRLVGRVRREGAFTLIELMIVVTIVAILALIAIPLYSANSVAAIMTEGVAGTSMVRDQMRVYLSQMGSYSGANYSASSNNIGIQSEDLNGKYFAQGDYTLTGVSSSTYTITVGPPSKTTRTTLQYQINQNGSETTSAGFYTSGM